jgi:hypothetical protein
MPPTVAMALRISSPKDPAPPQNPSAPSDQQRQSQSAAPAAAAPAAAAPAAAAPAAETALDRLLQVCVEDFLCLSELGLILFAQFRSRVCW